MGFPVLRKLSQVTLVSCSASVPSHYWGLPCFQEPETRGAAREPGFGCGKPLIAWREVNHRGQAVSRGSQKAVNCFFFKKRKKEQAVNSGAGRFNPAAGASRRAAELSGLRWCLSAQSKAVHGRVRFFSVELQKAV